jgi:hypothetical protein
MKGIQKQKMKIWMHCVDIVHMTHIYGRATSDNSGVAVSVVDPDLLNPVRSPDPALQVNLYPDPGF